MDRKSVFRKPGIKLVLVVLLLGMLTVENPLYANQDSYRYWGEVQQGIYEPLHPYTLNWTGNVLDRGGLNLFTLSVTSDSAEADIVINQYGALGARSIVKLGNEALEDRTSIYQQGAMQSVTMEQGAIYLVALSTGKYAKIQIDSIGADRVSFSYVLEKEAPPAQTESSIPWLPSDPLSPPTSPSQPGGPAAGPSQQPGSTPATPPAAQPQQPASVPMTIQLTIGQARATVQGETMELLAAPLIQNGTTLVPLRFIAESLGAEVEWNGADRSITLTQKDKTIVLYIDSTTAFINGRPHTLLAAPMIQNGTTLVPVRFISETFDMEVGYDAATRQVTITGTVASSGAANPSAGADAPRQASSDTLFGAWQLTAYGHEAGGVAIYPDGTYVHRVMWEGQRKGKWRLPEPGEYLDWPNAVILQYGEKGVDWAVAINDEGELVMSYRYVVNEGGLFGGRVLGWWHEYTGAKYSDNPDDVRQIRMSTIEYDYTKFHGQWKLWTEGGMVHLYDVYTGNYVSHEYVAGAGGGTVTIGSDGTYALNTTAGRQTGTWRPSDYNEVPEYNGGIILEAPDGKDAWAVYVTPSGKMVMAQDTGGTYLDGSKMWIIQFILEK